MIMLIYDSGKVYSYEIDPEHLPEWIVRAIELPEYKTIYTYK